MIQLVQFAVLHLMLQGLLMPDRGSILAMEPFQMRASSECMSLIYMIQEVQATFPFANLQEEHMYVGRAQMLIVMVDIFQGSLEHHQILDDEIYM
uniref:Uncharacterized protein n=1 Tax=Arundo donax TaxID=35708 RepID=A0A0A9DRH8_ARUDO